MVNSQPESRTESPLSSSHLACFESMRPRLLHFAWQLLGDNHSAEDMVQETAILYMQKRAQVQPGSERSWFFSVCRNLCRNERRRQKTLSLQDNDRALVDHGRQVQARHDLQKALQEVKPEFRDVLLLRILGDFSTAEVAEILSIPEGTVKSRLFHGTLALRRRLPGYGKE